MNPAISILKACISMKVEWELPVTMLTTTTIWYSNIRCLATGSSSMFCRCEVNWGLQHSTLLNVLFLLHLFDEASLVTLFIQWILSYSKKYWPLFRSEFSGSSLLLHLLDSNFPFTIKDRWAQSCSTIQLELSPSPYIVFTDVHETIYVAFVFFEQTTFSPIKIKLDFLMRFA